MDMFSKIKGLILMKNSPLCSLFLLKFCSPSLESGGGAHLGVVGAASTIIVIHCT